MIARTKPTATITRPELDDSDEDTRLLHMGPYEHMDAESGR